MTESDLLAFLTQLETTSSVFGTSELATAQANAINRYYGRDYGDEQSGRSRAKTHDVRELINWAMPALMRVFGASDDLITIDSNDDQDIPPETAKQMADGLNHIYSSDNDGYANTYDFLFDGLAQRVGVMQTRWQPPEQQPPELFENVDPAGLAKLNRRGYQITAHMPADEESPGGEQQEGADQDDNGAAAADRDGRDGQEPRGFPGQPLDFGLGHRFHVQAQKKKPGRVEIRSVPPEEFSWQPSARGLDESGYQRRIEKVYLADLKRSYPEKSVALDDASATDFPMTESQALWLARHQSDSSSAIWDTGPDQAKQVIHTHEFVRVDFDGDGIIELREVCRVGTIILYNAPVECSEYSIWTPVRIPHTVAGLSLADDAIEVQNITTALTRRGLDSLAASLNPRVAYDASATDTATIDALLDNRLAGVIPVNGDPSKSLMPVAVPDVSEMAMTWKQHFKAGLEAQTGIGPSTNGIDPNNLSVNQSGVAANLAQMASSGRLELIARAAAYGLGQVFAKALKLVVQHQGEVRQIQRVGRAPLVLDPAQWSPDASITLHVAIATANRNSQLAHLQMIAAKQEQVMLTLGPSNPITDLSKYLVTLRDMTETMGFRSPSRNWNEPGPQVDQAMQNMPPKPDPKVIAAQTAAQEMQAEQVRLDEKQQADLARMQNQMQQELALKRQQLVSELNLEREVAMERLKQDGEIARLRLAAGLSPSGNYGVTNGAGLSQVHPGGQPG